MCRVCNLEGDVHQVTVGGKAMRFTFSDNFGPLVVNGRGDPLVVQPIAEDHPFWAPFNAWLAEYRKANA